MTAKKLARAMADNYAKGKSNLPMLRFLVRTRRVPAGVTVTVTGDRYEVEYGNTETGIV